MREYYLEDKGTTYLRPHDGDRVLIDDGHVCVVVEDRIKDMCVMVCNDHGEHHLCDLGHIVAILRPIQ